jgi:putative transposase
VCDQGRLLQPDRRLLDRLTHESVPGGHRVTRGRAARDCGRAHRSQRPAELAQFRFKKYVGVLKTHQLRGAVGRVGAWGDNAAMESFFALLQKNVLDRQSWTSRHQLRLAIVSWIETSYHRDAGRAASANSHPSSLR